MDDMDIYCFLLCKETSTCTLQDFFCKSFSPFRVYIWHDGKIFHIFLENIFLESECFGIKVGRSRNFWIIFLWFKVSFEFSNFLILCTKFFFFNQRKIKRAARCTKAPAMCKVRERAWSQGPIIRSLTLHFCQRLFAWLEPLTWQQLYRLLQSLNPWLSWSHDENFTDYSKARFQSKENKSIWKTFFKTFKPTKHEKIEKSFS